MDEGGWWKMHVRGCWKIDEGDGEVDEGEDNKKAGEGKK